MILIMITRVNTIYKNLFYQNLIGYKYSNVYNEIDTQDTCLFFFANQTTYTK